MKKVPAKKAKKSSWKRFKNRLTFFILIAAMGFGFYLGWVQYRIPEGHTALVHSKWGGYEEELIQSGEFCWRWQGIIPTFLTIHLMPNTYRTVSIEERGKLPSGEIYSQHGGLNEDFSYHLKLYLNYKINPEHLAAEIRNGRLNPDSLEEYYTQWERTISSSLLDTLSSNNTTIINPEESIRQGISLPITPLMEQYPELEIQSLQLEAVDFPDLELYLTLKSEYLSYLARKNQAMEDALARLALEDHRDKNQLELVEEYGKLITQYPLLIDFFALENRPF